MKKAILTFDMKRYDHQKYDEYVDTVQKIFFHKNIRLTQDKIDLINQICRELPITLVDGEARNVKIRSIINIINMLLFLQNGEENSLAYRKKSIRTVKNGQEHYTTGYFFFFVTTTTGDEK